jgi:ubiquinone/menaquinone biosynthesis C-methylase UbiE
MFNISDLQKSFDLLAPKYDNEVNTFHHHISFFVTIENLLLELPKNKNIQILDSGGGTGKYTLYLAKLGYSVTLSDISAKSLDEALKKAKNEKINIQTIQCDSEHTNFPDELFDVIMLNGGVMSYSPNPDQLLKEAYRILKPNGIIFFDFFNSLGWAIENPSITNKTDLALSDLNIIQMPDWDYPARTMSIDYIDKLLSKNSFLLLSKYGLVILSNSLSLDTRYSTDYDNELLKKYQTIELTLSRKLDCLGSAWSCIVCAKKLSSDNV